MVSGKKALRQAGLEKEANPDGYSKLDPTRVGVLVGTGMGGLTVFQDGGCREQGFSLGRSCTTLAHRMQAWGTRVATVSLAFAWLANP